jgi:hypothetical protein
MKQLYTCLKQCPFYFYVHHRNQRLAACFTGVPSQDVGFSKTNPGFRYLVKDRPLTPYINAVQFVGSNRCVHDRLF